MVSCPLLTPLTFLCADTSEMLQRNGGYGGTIPGVLQLMGRCYCPEFTLRKPPRITVRGQTVQGGVHLCCDRLRFDQGLPLGAPNVPVGPSLLDARPEGVAS